MADAKARGSDAEYLRFLTQKVIYFWCNSFAPTKGRKECGMDNPFRYGCVVSGDHFCNRDKAERELRGLVKSGQNVFVQCVCE